MPYLGEIKRAIEIGFAPPARYIWVGCELCGKERWVQIKRGKPKNLRCCLCERKSPERREKQRIVMAANPLRCKAISQMMQAKGEKARSWKSGRTKTLQGYIQIKLQPNDFFYPMANMRGYVMEHRLIVAKALGRCLHLWEIVHHKGDAYPEGSIENKQDNRYPENLQLVTDDRHKQISILEAKIKRLEKQITELRR